MLDQSKNNRGFTLAELLMAIAIIMVLAAIAIPSVANAQRNMHMVELDSAANQIALAAQNQMTSMKVSGTWLDALEKSGIIFEGKDAQTAKNNPSGATGDTFYLTRAQIISLGILTPLSIEQTVFDGDYIVEFVKSTASIYGVFYSDGRTGALWNSGPAATGVMSTYYVKGDASPTQATRRNNNPPIGYYGGIPAGATNAVALENPNIWIDENSKNLAIDNPNYKVDKDSLVSVKISHQDEAKAGDFTISGFKIGSTSSISLSSIWGGFENEILIFGNDEEQVIVPVEGSSTEVQINLNALSKKMMAQENLAKMIELAELFKAEDMLKVEVEVTAEHKTFVPATSSAYIEWPGELAKLRILITDAKMEDFLKGSYLDPTVEAVVNVDNAMSLIEDKQSDPIKTTPSGLIGSDPGAAGQAYRGKWVNMDTAVEKKGLFKATVGGFTKVNDTTNEAEKTYQYQIYEIRVNGTLIGYFDGQAWQWSTEFDHSFVVNDKNESIDVVRPSTASVCFDAAKLKATGLVADEKGGYDIRVRTAPAMSDVRDYLSRNNGSAVASIEEDSKFLGSEMSSRILNLKSKFQSDFIFEFGASSSVALWSTKIGNLASPNEEVGFSDSDIYVYYSPTPYNPAVDELLYSSIVWRATKVESGYKLADYGALGTSFADNDPRLGGQTGSLKLVSPNSNTDFAIPVLQDYLFFRAFVYLDENGNSYSYNADNPGWIPWVPYNGINEKGEVVTSLAAKLAEGYPKTDYVFVGWTTQPDGKGDSFRSGASITEYENTLPLGRVNLHAHYVKSGIGLMYLEFDKSEKDYYDSTLGNAGFDKEKFNAEKNIIGWQGYFSANQSERLGDLAPAKQAIGSFGYYVVVPTGTPKPSVSGGTYQDSNLLLEKSAVNIGGTGSYDLYRLGGYAGIGSSIPEGNVEMRVSNRTITYSNKVAGVDYQATYTFNLNFASALIREKNAKTNPSLGRDASVKSPEIWGTADSPWSVRQALQYPGALSNNSAKNPQNTYKASCYIQEHDIDMLDTVRYNSYVYNQTVFSGVYDGGRYSVANVRARLTNNPISYPASGRSWGLFVAAENATITKVDIVETPQPKELENLNVTSNFNMYLGLLVGYAEDCFIQDCSITTMGFDGVSPTVTVTDNTGFGQLIPPSNVGGLIGRAEGTKILDDGYSAMRIQDCSIKGINLTLNTKNRVPTLGGLVGSASGVFIQGKNDLENPMVTKMKLAVSVTSSKTTPNMSFGSVVGKIQDTSGVASSIRECVATNVAFIAPKRTDLEKETAAFGAIIGWYTGVGSPIYNSQFELVTSAYENEVDVPVVKDIGYQD